jgi:hypothetical protein
VKGRVGPDAVRRDRSTYGRYVVRLLPFAAAPRTHQPGLSSPWSRQAVWLLESESGRPTVMSAKATCRFRRGSMRARLVPDARARPTDGKQGDVQRNLGPDYCGTNGLSDRARRTPKLTDEGGVASRGPKGIALVRIQYNTMLPLQPRALPVTIKSRRQRRISTTSVRRDGSFSFWNRERERYVRYPVRHES